MSKPGKYAEICKQLPRLLEEPSYQDKVNAKKAELLTRWAIETAENGDDTPAPPPTALQLARRYDSKRTEKEDIEEDLKGVQLELTAIEQLLVDRYEVEGVASIHLTEGVAIGVQLEPYASVVDRRACRLWAIEHGYEDMLQMPWQSLNAITKERLIAGDPEPDGVKAHTRPKLVRRQG